MGENYTAPVLDETHLNTLKHRVTGRIDTMNRKIATSHRSSWPQGHFRLWKVTSGFSAIPFDRDQLEQWKHHSCVQVNDMDRLIRDLFRTGHDLDLRLTISKFWKKHFIETLTCINRWKLRGNRSVGVALTSIQTFYEVRLLGVSWWPNLAWPVSERFTTHAEKMHDKACKKRHAASKFSVNLENLEVALQPPAPHKGEG